MNVTKTLCERHLHKHDLKKTIKSTIIESHPLSCVNEETFDASINYMHIDECENKLYSNMIYNLLVCYL